MKILAIGEARRRLPELVRRVAEGHPPVLIGRRGRPEALLTSPGLAVGAVKRRSLRGLITLLGSPEDVDEAHREIRRDLAASIERTAALIASPARKRPVRRASSRP